MFYIKCLWKHDDRSEEPDVIYCEFDGERTELRKIELYENGQHGVATQTFSTGDTHLADIAIPPLEEINADPRFEARDITAAEFEAVWQACQPYRGMHAQQYSTQPLHCKHIGTSDNAGIGANVMDNIPGSI
ncbi:DUF6881 domain-containing protein [Komagataeibacter xylinus]|uniref:DUF6881 domain-containing protein n=1 Tax=Komagataeibacter xylinus TaxID=28448 RepID=A0A857FN38_KOMXY|nr:hypothetical protein [Komagataeibacter xylinus]QHC34909.1 hypothetical protein FMA36_04795 [Komagataeibacter xylinus]